MIPAAANIPLTICSVVIRRFIDSYTGHLPLAVSASTIPTASTVALFSGALLCLCHQLTKGTLVRIGMGRRLSSLIKNSRHTIQRRVRNNSWFLRNIGACRRKCAEAMLRIARQSDDSLQDIQAETGLIETNSLPVFTRCTVVEKRQKHSIEPPVEKLYSNNSFDSQDDSSPDIKAENSKRGQRQGFNFSANRPITRNFRKSVPADTTCENSQNRSSPRKRKKSEHILNEPEDQPNLITRSRSRSEGRKQLPRRQLQTLSEETSEPEISLKPVSKRISERIKKQPKFQKITRKTRSGRVYAYRL